MPDAETPTGGAEPAQPPLYYVEPEGGTPPPVSEPGPPIHFDLEPPPPPLPRRSPPPTTFWTGIRLGWLSPFGTLWLDGYDQGYGRYYRRRSFGDYADAGPSLELDVGARLGRRYTVFALWEHTSLAPGSLEPDAFGGSQRGSMNLYGAGVRINTNPSSVGFAMELGLGYREFTAHWANGTELEMSDGWIDARLGVGADIRVQPWLSLSPMLVIGGGSFTTARWSGPSMSGQALSALDAYGQYGTVSLQVGGHVDMY